MTKYLRTSLPLRKVGSVERAECGSPASTVLCLAMMMSTNQYFELVLLH